MPIVHKSIIVPYTPQQMFDLVNDISHYPQFIPACVASEVIDANPDEIHATLHFSRSGFQKSFTTINRLSPYKMIEIRLLQGPFRQLEGFWRFEAVENNGCEIILDLEFEFSNKILAMMFGPIFHQVAVTLIEAFQQRAKVVYGEIQ